MTWPPLRWGWPLAIRFGAAGEPTWTETLISGLVLGLAELAKMTLVVFLPLWPVLWIVYRCAGRGTVPILLAKLGQSPGAKSGQSPGEQSGQPRTVPWLRELGMLAVRFLVALYILNVGYGFEGTGTRLGNFKFVSATLLAPSRARRRTSDGGNRFADSWLGNLPVPLPKNYLSGMDLQKRDFEDYRLPSYLRGEFRSKGWWYYYLYALAIKVPLGTWLLVVLAAAAGFLLRRSSRIEPPAFGRSAWRDEFVLLAPAVVILIFVSSQTGFSAPHAVCAADLSVCLHLERARCFAPTS